MAARINGYLQDYPVRVGLVASFFAECTDTQGLEIVGAFESYANRFGTVACYFSDSETNRVRKLDARSLAYPRRRWPKAKDGILVGLSASDDEDTPTDWNFVARLQVDPGRYLHRVWWSIDPAVESNETLGSMFLATARTVRCLHAYGGIGVVPPQGYMARQRAEPEALATAARFHGLDVLGVTRTSFDALNGIKCVNWLTLLDEALLAKVGGKSALRSALSDAIVFHDIPNGVVLQAGDKPVLGDVHAPDELAAYREVALALKPIFATGPFGTFRDMEGFPYGGTNPWRHRFFPGAKWPP